MSTSTQTNTKTINIIAVGGVSKILANFNKNQNLFAIETASNNLNALPDHIHKILFGPGNGSGGNPEFAASLFDESLVEPIFDCDLLILIAGLGGGTGSGLTPEIAKLAKEKGILTKLVCFAPLVVENSHKKAKEVLANFKTLDLPITLIDNQSIFDKTPEDGQVDDYQQKADYGASETVKTLQTFLEETEKIDPKDLKRILDYAGICYSNRAKGKDYQSALDILIKTSPFSPKELETAKGFLLSLKPGKSGISKSELLEIHSSISPKIDFKSSVDKSDSEHFEITILVTGIGTESKVDQAYFDSISQKQEQDKADYKSEVNSQNARQKFKN